GLEESVLLWNVVPTHPGSATSNRAPPPSRDRGRPSFRLRAGPRAARGRRRPLCGGRARRSVRAPPEPRRRGGIPCRAATIPPRRTVSSPLFMQKTWNAKPGEVERRWYLVDAEGKTLGRLATQIADTLRGKHKAEYTPHIDTGDFVVVVNAEKIAVTGNKLDDKMYHRHSGSPGGRRSRPLGVQIES